MKLFLNAIAALLVGSVVLFSACETDPDPDPEPEDKSTIYTESTLNDEDGNPVEVIVTVQDRGEGTGTITWDKTKTYVLDGLVFVNDGQVLTIPAGTIVKGKSGQGENASGLVVARGAKIMAEGTATEPIIFTAEADGIHYNQQSSQVEHEGNIPPTTRGLWGGLIVLGKGSTNNTTTDKSIEGIPTTETRGLYGGTDDNDNSGILKYISIRHGGTDIGEGNEINGLTFGAVGDGTTIDYVEVMSNKDDGFEWFGSTVTCKHLIAAFCGDDSYDYDQSFRGMGQFWLAVQHPNTGDRIGEHDGGPSDNETGMPYAIPQIYNATYIGRTGEGKRIITFRDNAGGHYINSIFVSQDKGIDIEFLTGSDDSYKQWQDGNLKVENNMFWNVADGTAAGIFKTSGDDPGTQANQDWADYFTTANNEVADPGIAIVISENGGLNPVPTNAVGNNMAAYPTGFDNVSYKGAFDPAGTNWAKGWTLLDHAGFLD